MPEAIILDKAGSLRGDLMKAHAEENDIRLDLVSSGNHRANGLAERIVREFNDRMNLTCKEHWKTWHKSIKQTELSLRVTPSADTGTSPAQLLFGRQMRTTFHGINNIPDLEENEPRRASARLAALRIRQITKQQDEAAAAGPRAPAMRTFTVGETVRLHTQGQETRKGIMEGLPARWWDHYGTKGTIMEILTGNNYRVKNLSTGNEVTRSGQSLAKIPQTSNHLHNITASTATAGSSL